MLRSVVNSGNLDKNIDGDQTEARPDANQHTWRHLVAWAAGVSVVLVALWWLIRWMQYRGYFEWVPDWLFLTSGLSAPVATLMASGGVIIAAVIAFRNGEKTRMEERKKWEESKDREDERRAEEQAKWEESKQQESAHSLRDRYFKITELLSENSSYAQREAAVYSLTALSDDWASFYGDGTEAATREQQTCLNVIIGQLRDPLPDKDDHEKTKERSELTVFKQRVQGVIAERYRPRGSSGQRTWSHLDLNLSFCCLYEPDFSSCLFAKGATFKSTNFSGHATFTRAEFTGFVDFQDAKFTGIVDFESVKITNIAYFKDVTFESLVDFRDAELTGGYTDFGDAEFTGGDTDFQGAKFTGRTYFWDVKFTGVTDFQRVTFTGHTEFWGALFTGEAVFTGVTFNDKADFQEAIFNDKADFQEAIFNGKTDFKGAKFLGGAVFGETEDQFREQQVNEYSQTTNTKRKGAVFLKSPSFEGRSQFTQMPNFNGTEFLAVPILADDSDPRDFFTGAILPDEQVIKE